MYKVLLVDDEPLIVEGLKQLINWEENELEIVGEANYGLKALEWLESNPAHILITDIKMPFMDGIELIRSIRNKGMNTKCIVLSGYDDFEYVKEAAQLGIENYLLKPVSEAELLSTLQNTRRKIESDVYKQIELKEGAGIIRNNLLYRWVTRDIQPHELLDRALFLNLNLDCAKYYVVDLNIQPKKADNTQAKIENRNLLRYAVQNIVEQTIGDAFSCLIFPDLDGDIIVIFTDTTSQQDRYLHNTVFPNIMHNLEVYLNIGSFITIGGYERDYRHVHKSYSQAKELLDYRLIKPMNKIIAHTDVSQPSADNQTKVSIDYSILGSLIIAQKRDSALAFVDELYESLSSDSGISPPRIQNITIELLFSITNAIKSLKINPEFSNFSDLYVNVLKIKTINELINWLKFIIEKSIQLLHQHKEHNTSLIQKMCSYIETNYAQDINLKTMAYEFGHTPAYLGQVFKKELEESFTYRLNKVRIDKAKTFLLHSQLKTNEISEEVGYFNTNYFYTVFKKHTGLSPTEYKVNPNDKT